MQNDTATDRLEDLEELARLKGFALTYCEAPKDMAGARPFVLISPAGTQQPFATAIGVMAFLQGLPDKPAQ